MMHNSCSCTLSLARDIMWLDMKVRGANNKPTGGGKPKKVDMGEPKWKYRMPDLLVNI